MQFEAQSRLVIGTLADLSGELKRLDRGFAARLDALRLRQQGVSATLSAPATVTVSDGAVDLTPLKLDFGTGSLTAQGRMAEAFDIDVAITTMPLALANAIRPDLQLAGTINGTARVTGPRGAPDVRFDIAAADVASTITRNAGLPPVSVTARGTTTRGRLGLDARVTAGGGLAAEARGSVPLGAGALDMTVDLQSFPVALVDRIAGNRGLRRHGDRAGDGARHPRRPRRGLQPPRRGPDRDGDVVERHPAGQRHDRRHLPRRGRSPCATRGRRAPGAWT